MPVALSPSNLFPVEPVGPMTTESRTAYEWKQSAESARPQPYRAGAAPQDAGIVPDAAPTVVGQLKSLEQRLNALQARVHGPPETKTTTSTEASNTEPNAWDAPYYDSCAAFAGEAARVKAAGRLAFGCARSPARFIGASHLLSINATT